MPVMRRERREAEHAKALLDFASLISRAPSFDSIGHETVRMAARLLDARQSSLWLQRESSDAYVCAAHFGHVGNPDLEPIILREIGASTGDGFLADRSGPFVATPNELELHFGDETRLAEAARTLAQQKYSRDAYLRRTADAYARLGRLDEARKEYELTLELNPRFNLWNRRWPIRGSCCCTRPGRACSGT